MCESESLYRDYSLVAKLKEIVNFYKRDREEYWETGGDGEWAAEDDDGFDYAWSIFDKAESLSEDIFKSSVNLSLLNPPEELKSFRKDYEEYIQRSIPKIKEQIRQIGNYKLINGKYIAYGSLENLLKYHSQTEPLRSKIPPKFDFEQFPLSLIKESVSIKLSLDFLDKINESADRVMDLFLMAIAITPEMPTKKFLDRVSNCYIWGFDSECVMLCRSVIDTAFHDKIKDDICENRFGKRNEHQQFGLYDRILVAALEGYIDEDTKSKALEIKIRGDKAIHEQPGITKNIFDTIKNTMIVIEQLYKNKSTE